MTTQPTVTFHDGRTMPQLGLGVWKASNQEAVTAIEAALDAGYRSIDTAAIYKNEEGVGQALRLRGKICLLPPNCGTATKPWPQRLSSKV